MTFLTFLTFRRFAPSSRSVIGLSCLMWCLACDGGEGDVAGTIGEGSSSGEDEGEGEGEGEGDEGDAGEPSCAEPPSGTKCVPGGTYTPSGTTTQVIPTLFVDTTEVTVAAYAACVEAGECVAAGATAGCNAPEPDRGGHPINCVRFDDALAYCQWRSARLPNEWEWEWAARGRDEARSFPWGEVAPANQACWEGAEPVPMSTCEVGSRSPEGDSRDGLADLAGNVWEWTDSWYDESQTTRTVRGASWVNSLESRLRADARLFNVPTAQPTDLGFRCVIDG